MESLEGLNIDQIIMLIEDPWNKESPVNLKDGKVEDYQQVPLLNQVKLFTRIIHDQNDVQLTKKGFLPTSIVKDLYQNGYIKNELIEIGVEKVYKEIDCEPVYFTRLICELCGIIKKRKNKFSLTKKGQELITNDSELFKVLMKTVTQRFNISFFDGYECEFTGQYGILITLYLLNKYGDQFQKPKFYSKKYMQLIPGIFNRFPQPTYSSKIKVFTDCFKSRTFERSLNYFGILEIERNSVIDIVRVKKSELFNRLIVFEYKLPPSKMN